MKIEGEIKNKREITKGREEFSRLMKKEKKRERNEEVQKQKNKNGVLECRRDDTRGSGRLEIPERFRNNWTL